MLATSDEEAKGGCMEAFRERKVKRCIYQTRKKVNEQFGRKMNEDVNGEFQQNKGCKWEVGTR